MDDSQNLEYFVVSLPSDGFWFADSRECWADNCDFEMHVRTNRRPAKNLFRWSSVEVYAILTWDCLVVYVLVLEEWSGCELNCPLLMPSLPVFLLYSGLTLCLFEADNMHVSLVEFTESIVFVLAVIFLPLLAMVF